jgi:hypothetical protein
MSERRDFPEWIVREVYIRQDGVCAKCGTTLAKGFHRHHIDGDATNNNPENLQLLCEECHYATFKSDELKEHRKLEREILSKLHDALHKTVEKELSGASLERIIMATSKILSISKHEKGLNQPLEQLPDLTIEDMEASFKAWVRGFKEGLKSGIELARREGGYKNG